MSPCSRSPIAVCLGICVCGLHPLSVPASTEDGAWGGDHEADDRYGRPELRGSGGEGSQRGLNGRPSGGEMRPNGWASAVVGQRRGPRANRGRRRPMR